MTSCWWSWTVALRRRIVVARRTLPGSRPTLRPRVWHWGLIAPLVVGAHVATATPLTKPEVIKLVRKNVQERRVVAVVRELGIDFKVTAEVTDELRAVGASATLIEALEAIAAGEERVAASGSAAPAPATPPAPLVAPPVVVVPPPALPAPVPPAPVPTADPAPPADDRSAVPPPEPLPAPAPPDRPTIETAALIPAAPPLPPPPAVLAPASAPVPEPRPAPPAIAREKPAAVPEPAPEPPSKWALVKPLLDKAQTLTQEGDIRGAQTLLARAIEIDPGEPQVWKAFKGIEQDLLARAETYLADGQLQRALREFQVVITTNPESALGHNGVGLTLLQIKNYDEAVAAFEKALTLEPANTRYRQALTRARSLQKASRALERTGQENLKEMIGDQPGRKKGP